MKPQEVIEELNKLKTGAPCSNIDRRNKAIEEAKDFTKAFIPEKPVLWNGQYSCPECESLFGNKEDIVQIDYAQSPHCRFCGQALDWGEKE